MPLSEDKTWFNDLVLAEVTKELGENWQGCERAKDLKRVSRVTKSAGYCH